VEPVAEIVAALESRGVSFSPNPAHVGFAVKDTSELLPEDTARIGELILEREEELRSFLEHRPARFGAYAGVFRAAVYRICTPPGMLVWLADRCPGLYRELTVVWPDAVQRLWEEGGSMEEFERVVRRLEEAHACALGFFTACQGGDQ